jgi:hypothetical protein
MSHLRCASNGKLARYNTGNPSPRPQSLAKIKVREPSSHAGEELLQSPAATTSVLPLTVSFSQSCLGPACVDSKANHFPPGESSEPSVVAGGKVDRATCRVAGSKVVVVYPPFFTNSK